ncbi:MAG: hypothetical protein QM765_32655 [Myxococcales bacterium]
MTTHRRDLVRRGASLAALALAAIAVSATSKSTCILGTGESTALLLKTAPGEARSEKVEIRASTDDLSSVRAWGKMRGTIDSPGGEASEVTLSVRPLDFEGPEDVQRLAAEPGQTTYFYLSFAGLEQRLPKAGIATYQFSLTVVRGSPSISTTAVVYLEPQSSESGCPSSESSMIPVEVTLSSL